MGIPAWAPTLARNAATDPAIQSADGASSRTFPESLRAIMAASRALADDQGGALVTTGTANAYVVWTASGLTSLRPGLSLAVWVDRTNTDLPSLNVDGTGPLPWRDADGRPFDAGRLKVGRLVYVTYDDEGRTWRSDILSSLDNTSDLQKATDPDNPIGGKLADLDLTKARKGANGRLDIGLPNVDNTSDAQKASDVANPIGGALSTLDLTKARKGANGRLDIGLPNVDNTSDLQKSQTGPIADAVNRRLLSFPTRAAAVAAQVQADVTALRLLGVARVGLGASEWARASAQPAHAVAFQSADGAWWEPADRSLITPEQAGAIGDGTADDYVALIQVRDYALLYGCPIRLTRTYYTSQAIDWRSVVLDPMAAARLSGAIDVAKFGRCLTSLLTLTDTAGIQFQTSVSPRDQRDPIEKAIWLDGAVAASTTRTYRQIDCTTIPYRQQIPYPASDTWTDTPAVLGSNPAAGQVAANTDQLTWNVATGGIWYAGFVPVHGGQALRAHFATAGNYLRGAFVRTTTGYWVIYANATATATLAIKLTGQSVATRVYPAWAGLANASAYQPGVSDWQIEVQNHRTWRLKLNGQDITGPIDTGDGSEIVDAGFGVLAPADAVVPAVDNWSLATTREATGRRACDLVIFGDSQAYSRTGDISHALREALDGSNGLRVGTITNNAVPGTNTFDAYQAFVAKGVGAARYAILVSGVNDQQAGSDVAYTRQYVGAWIDGVRAYGAIPIVVIEPRFYLKSEGNPNGFTTSNAGTQVDYRGAIIAVAAGRGVRIVDANETLGAVVPGGIANAFQTIEDNIHLNPYAKMLLAVAIGKAILAEECGIMTASIAEKQLPALFLNGWGGITQYPTYSVQEVGGARRMFLGGLVDVNTLDPSGRTLVYRLPVNLRPKSTKRIVVPVGGVGGFALLEADTLGGIYVSQLPVGATYVSLDGMSLELA